MYSKQSTLAELLNWIQIATNHSLILVRCNRGKELSKVKSKFQVVASTSAMFETLRI